MVAKIKRIVRRLVAEAGTSNPLAIANHVGVNVDCYPLGETRGMIAEVGGSIVICVNAALPFWLRRYTLAHELGHYFLSSARRPCFFYASAPFAYTSSSECEANCFAVSLLCYGEDILPEETIEQYAARVGVPAKTMNWYINVLGGHKR